MLDAQVKANVINDSVRVSIGGYSTLVEPNVPRFTPQELSSRLSEALKSLDALNRRKPVLLSSDNEDEDDDEVDFLSQSILRYSKSTKNATRKKHDKIPVKTTGVIADKTADVIPDKTSYVITDKTSD